MKKIWLVDDSPTILMSILGLLRMEGHEERGFQDPRDALAALRGGPPPDLVITDLNMPEMNGIALIREIKRLPSCRFLPILMLTTESQQEKRAEAKAAGATGWLVKPVAPENLRAVIQKVLPG